MSRRRKCGALGGQCGDVVEGAAASETKEWGFFDFVLGGAGLESVEGPSDSEDMHVMAMSTHSINSMIGEEGTRSEGEKQTDKSINILMPASRKMF